MPIIKSIYWKQDSADDLVYQFPFKDIALGSVLTVYEGQEAYFYKNGVVCDRFKPGRHVLSSPNIPILRTLVELPSGGESTFKANVWFVSLLEKRNILWGAGGLRVIDPYFQIPIKLSARGQYGVKIKDGGLFLQKFVGTQMFLTTDHILEQFRSDVIEAIKVSIANFMKQNKVNINELGTEYKNLSKTVAGELQNSFDEYGIMLLNFNIEDINFDEEDKGYQTVMEGIAEQAKLNKLGVNYVQQKQIDIAQSLAGNQGIGNFMGVGMGLGVGQQVGQVLGQTINSSPINQAPSLPSFYVADNGATTGPFKLDVIQNKIMNGEMNANTYVYRVGGTAWKTAINEPEIADILNRMAPPPPPPPPPTL